MVAAPGQLIILVHYLVGDCGEVIEKIGTLGDDRLHVGILILHRTGQYRVVDGPQFRDAPAGVTVQQALGRGGAVDNVVRSAQEFGDQFTLGDLQGFDQVSGQEAVLAHYRGGEREFRELAANQVQVRGLLGIPGHDLRETGVVDAMVVVMAAMDIEAGFGDGAAAHVEHIGQPFADCRIQ